MFLEMSNHIYNGLKIFRTFYISLKYQWDLKGQEVEGNMGHLGQYGSGTPPFPFSHQGGKAGRGGAPPFLPLGPSARERGAPAPYGLVCLPPMAHKAHIFPRGVPVTSRYSEKYPNHSEPFRCPNATFQ